MCVPSAGEQAVGLFERDEWCNSLAVNCHVCCVAPFDEGWLPVIIFNEPKRRVLCVCVFGLSPEPEFT